MNYNNLNAKDICDLKRSLVDLDMELSRDKLDKTNLTFFTIVRLSFARRISFAIWLNPTILTAFAIPFLTLRLTITQLFFNIYKNVSINKSTYL